VDDLMTEADLKRLVATFYARVRADDMIGPLFNAAVADSPDHLAKLEDFWSSVMLTSGRYKGSPMAAHLHHAAAIEPAMFDRWLELWRETARKLLAQEDAAAIVAKAERIAESLKLALFFRIAPERGRAAA
jgi:hemoglobin